jgi:hypothetical protein
MPRTWTNATTTCALLLALIACGKGPLDGRYYQNGQYIEFKRDGFAVAGYSGDAVRYRIDGQKIILSPSGTIEGEIVSPTTVRFASGDGAMGKAFAGMWIATPASRNELSGSSAQDAAGRITGLWRAADETRLEFKTDGTYSMGPRVGGPYRMLQGGRVRMTVMEDGRQIGEIDQSYTFDEDARILKLTMPDGSTTTYERER